MDETRKAEDEDLESTRDVLQKWNDYYINNNFGIGIQCDKCKKWREVFQYQDPSEVPEVWICSMWKIDEIHRGSCRLPSDLNEDDFAETRYAPGCLVWAKLNGFPWWPAMIEDCPDNQNYFMPYVDSEHEYHVNFFGSKPLRNWIKASYIKDFTSPPPMTPKAKKNKDLQKSIEQANKALKMDVKERLKNYSFAVRYKGHWAKVKKLDKVELPPNCLKRRRIEKSTEVRSQVMAEEPHVNQDCHRSSTVRKVRNVKSKSEAATKRKSVDNEEFQPTVREKEKTEKNNGPRNQFVGLGKAGDNEKQQSPVKCVQQSVEPKSECPADTEKEENVETSEEEDSPVHNNTTMYSDSEDEDMDSPELKAYSEFLNKKYPPILYDAHVDAESLSGDNGNNSSHGSSDFTIHNEHEATFSKNVSIINHENAAEFSENNAVINHGNVAEYSQNNTVINQGNAAEYSQNNTVINHENAAEFSENNTVINHGNAAEYSQNNTVINHGNAAEYSQNNTVINHENAAEFSENNTVINHGNAAEYSQNNTVINHGNAAENSQNNTVINHENAAEFSENNTVINHGNAAEYSQNDSDAYILDTLLQTPYPSCFTPKNEHFSKQCERFMRNRELSDELINSKYMPYSYYRRRMTK